MSERSIKLISWTLAGPGTEEIIGDALRSVAPIADTALLLLTGHTEQPLEEAKLVAKSLFFLPASPSGASFDLAWIRWAWCADFGAARNAGLGFSNERRADWSCMLDTDERVICPDPDALRAFLAGLPEHVVVALAHAADGTHTRERFFRHPCRHKFVGRTHESFTALLHEQAIIPRELITWTELPKSPEQLQAKFERDVRMLREDIGENERDGRALFYLGQTLQALGRYQEAIDALREFHRLDTWEGGAWGCYRAAECYLALGQPDRAIDCALAGMARDAGIAELPWIAAVASLQVGRLEQARSWALLAKVHGMGSEAERRRVGFRVPRGLTTGPEEVLEAVRARLGSGSSGPIRLNDSAHLQGHLIHQPRLAPDAHCSTLAMKMIEISQRCYQAYWLDSLSKDLWEFLRTGPGLYGNGTVTEADLEDLRRLSADRWADWSIVGGHPVDIPRPQTT